MHSTESGSVVCRTGKHSLCKHVCALLCPEILPMVLCVSGSAAQNELTTCFSLVKSKPTWLHPEELSSEAVQSLPTETYANDVYFSGQHVSWGSTNKFTRSIHTAQNTGTQTLQWSFDWGRWQGEAETMAVFMKALAGRSSLAGTGSPYCSLIWRSKSCRSSSIFCRALRQEG